MTIKVLPELKAGDTLSLGGFCNLPAGEWVATCHVRKLYTDELVGAVEVTLGTFEEGVTPILLEAAADETETWLPPSDQYVSQACWLDVRFADDSGIVKHTVNLTMTVIQPITKATLP